MPRARETEHTGVVREALREARALRRERRLVALGVLADREHVEPAPFEACQEFRVDGDDIPGA